MDSNILALFKEMYPQEEIDAIEVVKTTNERYEDVFKKECDYWVKNVNDVTDILRSNVNSIDKNQILEAQALSISYRQILNDKVTKYLRRLTMEEVKLKEIVQQKMVFYMIGFAAKTNGSEKNKLIDAHTAHLERSVNLLESQIDFLRTTAKNFESIQYSIKSMIELFTFLKQ